MSPARSIAFLSSTVTDAATRSIATGARIAVTTTVPSASGVAAASGAGADTGGWLADWAKRGLGAISATPAIG